MVTVLGKCLADRAQGASDAGFSTTELRPVPYQLAIGVAVAWKRTLDRLDDARSRRGQ